MSTALQVADDACLFVIDDEGLFFSGVRGELYIFNMTATFVWCALEAGLSPAEISAAYAETFAREPALADAEITELLSQWQDLGYIEGAESIQAAPLDFTTALARLLANSRLREKFAESPAKITEQLHIKDGAREAILAIDPAALDAQVEQLAEQEKLKRQGSGADRTGMLHSAMFTEDMTVLDAAMRLSLQAPEASIRTGYYKLLDTTFCLRYHSTTAEEILDPVLAHFEVGAPSDSDVVLDIVEGDGGYIVLHDIAPIDHCPLPHMLAPAVKNAVRQLAVQNCDFFMEIHAGVLARGDQALLLPGAPGSGKTTLTAGLGKSGFGYLSDEVAILQTDSLKLRPVPLGLGIKDGAVDVLASRWPELRELPAHTREDRIRVRYAPPPSGNDLWDREFDARWIIFPRYDADCTTELHALSRGDALRRLMEECMVLPQQLGCGSAQNIAAWLRGIDCYELPMSSLDEAIALITDMTASS